MRNVYVAGFLFRASRTGLGKDVLLVEKQKPSWQRELLNGIGGKHEGREMLIDTMHREFQEETGLDISRARWHRFACEEKPGDYVVHFYRAQLDQPGEDGGVPDINDVGEALLWVPVQALPNVRVVGNLRWLVPLAEDWRTFTAQVSTQSSIKERADW
jgi:8-oxo-dGTP diphosphatase